MPGRTAAARRAGLLVLAVGLAACEIDEQFVAPSGESRLVLHAILSPNGFYQTFLLERMWDGTRYVAKYGLPSECPPCIPAYSPGNPIVTGGGYPELLADIEVTTPSGQILSAVEPRAANGESIGGGRYLLFYAGMGVAAGGTFTIRVHTQSGETLTAEATVPHYLPEAPLLTASFDRVRDTLRLQWSRVSRARAYQVVVQNPYATFRFFTESTVVRFPGTLRNTAAEGLPLAFLPGFDQAVSIHAVDSNYYDYYRTANTQVIHAGQPSLVQGGFGVFGAALPIVRRKVRVTAPFRQPPEGTWRFLGSAADSQRTVVWEFTLNLLTDDPGDRAATSGRFRMRPRVFFPDYPLADSIGAYLGEKWQDSVRLTFLSQQRITDTMAVFAGRLAGDTLTGSYLRRTGTWRFVRIP